MYKRILTLALALLLMVTPLLFATPAAAAEEYSDMVTVNVKVPYSPEVIFLWDEVYLFAFSGTDPLAAWPGTPLTPGNDGWWYADIPAGYNCLVVNNGADEQCPDTYTYFMPGDTVYIDATNIYNPIVYYSYSEMVANCTHKSHSIFQECDICGSIVAHNFDINGYCACGTKAPPMRTIYFRDTTNWSNVNYYCWYTPTEIVSAAWPGTPMTKVEDGIYSCTVPMDVPNIIFNHGTGSPQTEDLVLPLCTSPDDIYIFNNDTKKFELYVENDEPQNKPIGSINVYAFIPEHWNEVYLWAWDDAFNNAEPGAAWPGELCMTYVGDGAYYMEIPAGYNNMLLTDRGIEQTIDISTSVEPGGEIYIDATDPANPIVYYSMSELVDNCPHNFHDNNGMCTVCGTIVDHVFDTNGYCSCGEYRQSSVIIRPGDSGIILNPDIDSDMLVTPEGGNSIFYPQDGMVSEEAQMGSVPRFLVLILVVVVVLILALLALAVPIVLVVVVVIIIVAIVKKKKKK